jgi:hypothetical protein
MIGGVAALLLLLVGEGQAGTRRGSCSKALPPAPAGLPSPVVVTTPCGRFRLDPSGRVVYKGRRTKPVAAEALTYWMDLTWYGVAHGRLLIGRGLKRLWRSHDTYRGAGRRGDVGAIALGRSRLAFSYFERWPSPARLYLAPYGGAEQLVARGETPLTFLDSGEFLSWRRRGGALVLRAGDGHLERLLAPHARLPQVDPVSKIVLFRTGARLYVYDGVRVRELASLHRLGLSQRLTVDQLGRLVAVHDLRRLVVLDYAGRVVASTQLPHRRRLGDGVSSSAVVNAAGTAVAFTTTSGGRSREQIYVLPVGQRRARRIFDLKLGTQQGCGRAASLAWLGSRLLYSDTAQEAAIVDSWGREPPVDLSRVVARLPGFRVGMFGIGWA